MSLNYPNSLEDAIRDSGEGWLIDAPTPRSEGLDRIRQALAAAQAEANHRGLHGSVVLDDASLVAEYARNPLKLKSLFQAIGAASTPEMLLMAWRVIQGMEFKELSISYETRLGGFTMRVVLEVPDGDGGDEIYESSSVRDFRLLRHIGCFEIGGLPMLEGFYPLKVDAPARVAT